MGNDLELNDVIEILGLTPLPIEGGYFRVTYTSDDRLDVNALPDRYQNDRQLAGAIYFLETTEQFSAMHSLPTDEIYYHHFGDPMEMLFLYPDGSGEIKILGPDLKNNQQPQIVAPKFCIHGSRPLPDAEFAYSLGSTSMAPGYHETDPLFPMRDDLIQRYPEFSDLITSLTRLQPHNV